MPEIDPPQFEPQNLAFRDVVQASFMRQGLLVDLGARLREVEPGRVRIALDFSDRLSQQHGQFHGAAVGAIADSAGGYAALTLMPAGSEVVTVEYKINFIRPARGDILVATGQVIRAGRTITVANIDVVPETNGEAGDAVAVVQATFMRVAG